MVSKRSVYRKKLSRQIARHMGTLSGKELISETHPKIQQMFHPHSQKGPVAAYPLYQIFHEFAKLPKENIENFVSVSEIEKILRTVPEISRLLGRHKFLKNVFRRNLQRAIRERGIKASKFWEMAPKSFIDKIASAAGKTPNQMNTKVGEIARDFFGHEIKQRTILDIGTFAGGTILAVVQHLSAEQKKHLRLVLVDVNSAVVEQYAVPELVRLGVPRANITVLPTSFYNAAVAFGHMPAPFHEKGEQKYKKTFVSLAKKVDLITAGASTINFANDLSPLLKSIRTLLKHGGMFVDWEWGSAEVRERRVNIEKLKHTLIGKINERHITEFDAYVSFLDFWVGFFNYPQTVKQRLFDDIERSKEFDFLEWCEKNVHWMEEERRKAGQPVLPDPAGYRNRAYRTGDAMFNAAKIHRFEVEKPIYPLGKPGEKNTGNVNWLIVARKTH